ncbi:MAG: hypothetical protein AMXMBFR76_21670 [Pseudomonadota bacterium]
MARYAITLVNGIEKHKMIDQFIRKNCAIDGRGVRIQPLIEEIFYACAKSGLTAEEIARLIAKAGEESAHTRTVALDDSRVSNHAASGAGSADVAQSVSPDPAQDEPVTVAPGALADDEIGDGDARSRGMQTLMHGLNLGIK